MFGIPRTVLALLAAFVVLHAWNLGAAELTDTDESRSGCLVRDMVEGGHWLLPRTPDGVLCEKPPVYYATTAVLVKVFSRNEATLRLFSLSMAVVALGVTAWLAALLGSPRASWIAVAALASNLIFIRWTRQAMVDMTFAAFLTIGFTAYVAARLGRVRARTAAIVCGISFALAILTKGPLGLALPIAVIGGDALVTSRGRFWKLPIPWGVGALGFALAVLIPLAWYLPAYKAGGGEFLKTSVLTENFRMPVGDAEDTGVSHKKSLLYYFWNQLVFLIPMLPLLPETVRWLADRRSDPARAPLAAWAAFGFLLFLVPVNKRHYYLLPLQPAFAVMIGLAADAAIREERRRLLAWGAGLFGALLIAASAVGVLAHRNPSILGKRMDPELIGAAQGHSGMILFFALLGVGIGAAMLASLPKHIGLLPRFVAAVGLFVVAGDSMVVDAVASSLNLNERFVREATTRVGKNPAAVLPPFNTYGLHYYWPDRLPQEDAAAARAPFVFVQRSHLDRLSGPYEVLAVRRHGVTARDVLLVRRE